MEKELVEAIKQSALSANANSAQQVTAINAVSEALQKQKKATDDTNKATKDASDNLSLLTSGVKTFAGMIATAFAISEIKSFGEQIIDAKTKIDSVKIALDTMIGNKRESAELYQQIVQLAKATPFSLQEVSEQVSKLKAYNIETSDLIPTITALGNIAAAVGKEKLPQLTLAYGQVRNANVLMGTELRQFTEAGVPLLDLISVAYGKTREEVNKMAADHQISFAMVRKALMDASADGGKYAGLMVQMSKTVGGEISNLADNFFVAKGRIGDFFEKEIRAGTRYLNDLVTSLAGSNAAIQRTVTFIESAVVAFTTWKVAVNAGKLAQEAWTLTTKAAELVAGTYNMTMIAMKGTTEGFTEAQIASAAAARSTWAAISANPLGALLTVVGVVTSAYLAWKAATTEVAEAMGEQEYQLQKEKSELNALVQVALAAELGTKRRKDAIAELIAKYPDYFSGLSTEKTTNDQLRSILDKVNASYRDRIDLAREAYKTDKLGEQRKALFEQEQELFERVKKTNALNEEVVQSFGGSAEKLLNYMKSNRQAAMDLNSSWDVLFKGTIGEAARNIVKQQGEIEKGYATSAANILTIREKEKASAIKLEDETHQARMKQLDDGSKEERVEIERHNVAIAKLNGTYREKELKETVDHEEKKKTVTLLSAKDIAVIKKEAGQVEQQDRLKELKDQLDTLNKREDQEIESIKKITVNRKISNAELVALHDKAEKEITALVAKNNLERADIMKKIEEEKMTLFLKSAKETNEKIEVLTAQRLEAEATLTKLNNARTNEERLAALREFNNKFNLDQKAAAVEQLRIQLDNSTKELADVKAKNGEKGDEYRRAYSQWQKDNLAYNQAVKDQTVTAAKETAQQIKEYEQEIRQAKQETAQLDKETAAVQARSTKEIINLGINLIGQQSGLLSQLGTAIRAVSDNVDALSSKAVQAASDMVKNAEDALVGIKMIYSDGTAEGDAMIAKANRDVADANNKAAKVKADSDAALMGVTSVVVQTILAIAQAIRERLSEAYKAAADSVGHLRDVNQELFELIEQGSRESYEAALQAAEGNLQQQLAIVEDFYARQDELARSTARIDAELAYNQKFFELKGEQKKFLIWWEQDEKDREYQQQARYYSEIIRMQSVLSELDRKKDKLQEVHAKEIELIDSALQHFKEAKQEEINGINDLKEQRIKALNDELDAYRQNKNEEINILTQTLATQKALLDTNSGDDKLRLTTDDIFRAQLLAQGEAREVQALEDAKQRSLARSSSVEESARIINSFNELIANKHKEYEEAKGNKSAEVQLAIKEVTAQTNDAIQAKTKETQTTIDGIQDAIKDKEDKTQLAILNINTQTKDAIIELQNQIKQQEAQAAYDRAVSNGKYAQAVWETNAAIWEQTKQLKVLELQAEIAKLESQKSWTGIGNGAINSAIDTVRGLIAQIQGMGYGAPRPQGTDPSIAIVDGNRQQTGSDATRRYQVDMNKTGNNVGGPGSPIREDTLQLLGQGVDVGLFLNGNTVRLSYDVGGKRTALKDGNGNTVWVAFAHGYSMDKDGNQIDRFFEGTPFVELGANPDGRDTVPAMVNKGERIVPTVLNNILGGKKLSNEELVDKVLFSDRFTEAFPQMANLMPTTGNMVMKLPDELMRTQQIDVSGLRKELKGLRHDMQNLKQIQINMDEYGFTKHIISQQAKITYLTNRFKQ